VKSGKSRATILGFPFFFVLIFSTTAAAQHALHSIPAVPQELLERPVTLRTGIGAVHDDAGTKNVEAQRFYDQGLAYLHNYVWIEAARSFNQALRSDPNLALAQSGLSVAYIELNKPTESRQAIEKAKSLSVKSVDHIKRHVDARALQMLAEEAPADSTTMVRRRATTTARIGSVDLSIARSS